MQNGLVTRDNLYCPFVLGGGYLNAQGKSRICRTILHRIAFITTYSNYFFTYLLLHQSLRCLSPGNTPFTSALQILVTAPGEW